MDNIVHPTAKGIIPNFFYDVIAFIIPGGWLILGGLLMWYGQLWCEWLVSPASSLWVTHPLDIPLAIAALIFAAFFFLFLGASSLVGFLISSLSHPLVETLLWRNSKINLAGLKNFIGSNSIEKLIQQFKLQFGFELTDDNISKASFLCSYFIWRRDSNLGMMTARLDAEKLASQSSFFVSCVLLLEGLIRHSMGSSIFHFRLYDLSWITCLCACIGAGALAFNYHRKKRTYARFAIYLAVVCENTKSIPRAGVGTSRH
jgi:hypothetical protein